MTIFPAFPPVSPVPSVPPVPLIPLVPPVSPVLQSPVRLALPPVPLVAAHPILPAFSALSENFSFIPSLYFRYRKDTGSPKD